MKECLICFDLKHKNLQNECFNLECRKNICNDCLKILTTSSSIKLNDMKVLYCPFCKNPFNSYIKILNTNYKVLGIDNKNKLFKLEYDNIISYKYFNSFVLWEETPPNCVKCDNDIICPREHYNFQTNYPKKELIKYIFNAEDNTEKMVFKQ